MPTYTARDLRVLTTDWGRGDWSNRIAGLRADSETGVTEDAIAFLADAVTAEIDRGRFQRASNWALLGLTLGGRALLSEPRWQDCFRPTRVRADLLPGLVRVLHSVHATLTARQFPDPIRERLSSWAHYAQLYAETRKDEHILLRQLRSARRHSLHGLLILADKAFVHHTLPPEEQRVQTTHDRHPGKRTFTDLSPEELAAAASYAVEAYSRSYNLSRANFARFDPSTPTPDSFKDIALLAARLREVLDLEASVFRLGYRCGMSAPRTYFILPPTDHFGMALAFGYIKEGWVPYRFEDRAARATTFASICRDWYVRFGKDSIQFVRTGSLTHLRVEVPKPVATLFGQEVLMVDVLFREELLAVCTACYEWMVDYETLLQMRVGQALSLRDVLKITRVFRFLTYLRTMELQRPGHDIFVCWNSILAGAEYKSLIALLCAFGVSEDAARDYVGLTSWDWQAPHFLDLQYTPLLRGDNWISIPGSILSGSNLMRSALLARQRRFYASGDEDPVSYLMFEAFKAVTDVVQVKLSYRFNGEEGDVDCIAKIGDTVYVCECKNTLHPCSAFEQRTMFDHIEKAAAQLERLKRLWSVSAFRQYIGVKLGCSCEGADLRTCIVLSTRLLSGASAEGNPIRQARELGNFIAGGTARIAVGSKEREFRMWAGETFTKEDLDGYLSDEGGRVYTSIWEAFSFEDVRWDFARVSLSTRVYGFDAIKHLHALGFDDLVEELVGMLAPSA